MLCLGLKNETSFILLAIRKLIVEEKCSLLTLALKLTYLILWIGEVSNKFLQIL